MTATGATQMMANVNHLANDIGYILVKTFLAFGGLVIGLGIIVLMLMPFLGLRAMFEANKPTEITGDVDRAPHLPGEPIDTEGPQ